MSTTGEHFNRSIGIYLWDTPGYNYGASRSSTSGYKSGCLHVPRVLSSCSFIALLGYVFLGISRSVSPGIFSRLFSDAPWWQSWITGWIRWNPNLIMAPFNAVHPFQSTNQYDTRLFGKDFLRSSRFHPKPRGLLPNHEDQGRPQNQSSGFIVKRKCTAMVREIQGGVFPLGTIVGSACLTI